jgi:pimeloyl-ACP methyl ester carboxylesterase
VEFASKQQFKGLVLESPYTSIFGVVNESVADYSCCLNPFNNESKISSVECPIIIFHGSEDDIIDFDHSKKLLELSNNCRLIELKGGNHNNLSRLFEEEMIEEINTLL